MYAPSVRRLDYIPARKTLTVFAVITLVLLVVTLVVAIMCMRNFGKGLKPHVEESSSFFWGGKKPVAADEPWEYSTYGNNGAGHSGGKTGAGPDSGVYMDSMTAHRVDYGPGYGGGGSRMTID